MRKVSLIVVAVLLFVTATMAQGNQNSTGASTNAITESIPVIPGVAEIKGPNRGETRIGPLISATPGMTGMDSVIAFVLAPVLF